MTLTTPASALVLVALALAPLGCGGGESATVTDGTNATTTQPTTSTGTTNGTTTKQTTEKQTTEKQTTETAPGETVGEITKLEKQQLQVDEEEVDSEIDLRAGNLLETDETGVVTFVLDIGSGCDMLHDAGARVQPARDIAVEFIRGTFWCSEEGGEPHKYNVPGGTLRASEPVFGVMIDRDGTTVKVTRGLVDVQSASGETVRVAPALQVSLLTNGDFVSEPQAIQLTTIDRMRADIREGRHQRPDVRPDPGSSDALSRVFGQGKLVVAVDSADTGGGEFGRAFATSLANAWDIDVEVVPIDAEGGARGLADESFDVVLTPADVQATVGASTVPLFEDSAGRTWNLNVAADEAFASSLRQFVSADVLTGDYAARYQQAISSKVTYEPVARFALRR